MFAQSCRIRSTIKISLKITIKNNVRKSHEIYAPYTSFTIATNFNKKSNSVHKYFT